MIFRSTTPTLIRLSRAASYSLAVEYDPKLDNYLDSVINLIALLPGSLTAISPLVSPTSASAFLDGGALTAGKKSTAMSSTTAATFMRLPWLTISPQGRSLFSMWLSRTPTLCARRSAMAKARYSTLRASYRGDGACQNI